MWNFTICAPPNYVHILQYRLLCPFIQISPSARGFNSYCYYPLWSFVFFFNIDAFNKSSCTAFNRCAYTCHRINVCVSVYILKRNYIKDLLQYTWKMKANPAWKECYHWFNWFHLVDKSSFGCFSYCCLSLATMVIVMFFLCFFRPLLVMMLRFILSKMRPYNIRWLCIV